MPFDYTLIWTALTVLFASFVNSAFGFGFGLVVMPLLLFVFELKTATPFAAGTGIIVALIITIVLRHHIRLKAIWNTLLSGIAGFPVGLAILVWVHNDILVTVLGVVIIGYSIFQLTSKKTIHLRSESFSFVFGFFAGLLSVSYNIPAPPLVIYATLRRWNPVVFKATLNGLFIVFCLLANISHLSAGLWDKSLLKLLLICIPFIVAGVMTGFWLSRFIKPEKFKLYINFMLILLGAMIIYRSARM